MTIITDLTIDELTSNLKKSLKNKHNLVLKDLKVRELVAQTLGFKNANTMIGMAKKEEKSFSMDMGLSDFDFGDFVSDKTDFSIGIGKFKGISRETQICQVDFGFGNIKECPASNLELFNSYNPEHDLFSPKNTNAVVALISSDDSNVSCELDITHYLKFLSLEDLSFLITSPTGGEESDKIYEFFSMLGALDILDNYLEHKNQDEVVEGYSVAIEQSSIIEFTNNNKDFLK